MKNVSIYARVSDTSSNPENRLLELRDVAERNGWSVTKEYVDYGISGAKGRDKRPEFDACLKSAIKREVDVVMFWSIDRASRSLQHLVEMMNELHSKNVDLYFHQQSIDTTTPSGRAMFQMCGVFAEFERGVIRERILASHKRALAEGKHIGRPSNLNDGLIKSVQFMREKEMGIKMFVPTQEQFDERHKANLNDFGSNHGIKVPESKMIFSTAEIPDLQEEFGYPMVVKGKFYDAAIAYTPEQAVNHFNKISAKWGLPIIVQKFVHGQEVNVTALGDGKGTTVGAVAMRKTYITDKGKAWAGIAIKDKKLMDMTTSMISSTKWKGGLELEIMKVRLVTAKVKV